MAYDLGDVAPLSVNTYDATGVLANATTVTLTITKPDGTLDGPYTVAPTTTGVYNYSYTPAAIGRYVASWVATGTNASAFSDVFDVSDTSGAGLVSLADVKTYMNMSASNTANDNALRQLISAASAMWTGKVGPVAGRVSYDERYDGGSPYITLRHAPIVSVTSVVEAWGSTFNKTLTNSQPDGGAGSAYDYSADLSSGLLIRRAMGVAVPFVGGRQNVHVVYVAGLATVPADIQQAMFLLVAHMWETQRGRMVVPGQGGGDSWNPGMGYMWPRRVLEIAQNYYIPGIA